MVDIRYNLGIVTNNRNILIQFGKRLAEGAGMFWQTDSKEASGVFKKTKLRTCVFTILMAVFKNSSALLMHENLFVFSRLCTKI